jgi:Ca2+-binding RTX toxin-like protein
MKRRVLPLSVAAAGLVVAVSPVTGQAGTSAGAHDLRAVLHFRSAGDRLVVDGGPGPETIRLRPIHTKAGGVEVTDSSGLMRVRRTRCHVKTPREALCPQPRTVFADGAAGDDRIRGIGSLHIGLDATLNGGSGSDLLIAGAGHPELNGGPGSDRLRGGRGHDLMVGGGGPDSFHASRANDIVVADGGAHDRDHVIACGRGSDLALVDKADPKPKHCETIR